ncbi:sulfotransferase 1B1-like isoform X2 [Mytilus californianus]|uniref:sulfotransferase 1B1-like isoform X2 n=1 Tax=Mytilus californianus TaxID=6549 RepID=UPI002245A52F|nr:sulfotransferase 1B1-like isoform X2 [Mytilus californianus]
MKPIPLPEYEGVRFPAFNIIREKGIEKAIQDIREIQSRKSDIMICTYPKSGTHWVNEVTNMLIRNKTELDTVTKVSTMLEVIPDLSVLDALPSPRLLNTHYSFKYLPMQHIENRCKIIHMIRNPKDVCVSFYYHSKSDTFLDFTGTWDDFFEMWMSDKCPNGSWYNYEKEMEQAEKDFPGMIFNCYFEEMKKDNTGEIQRLANFLGIPCTEKIIENIAETTSFNHMQKNKLDMTEVISGKGFIYRKGEIGDWKNHFTVAQNERFDVQYTERFKDSSYKLSFEQIKET